MRIAGFLAAALGAGPLTQQALVRRFLAAYGPADARDFCKWSGVTMVEAKQAWDHLVERRHYKRVYRNLGWLSPVVLVSGRIAGVWFARASARTPAIDVELFARPTKSIRARVEEGAADPGRFLGAPCAVSWS